LWDNGRMPGSIGLFIRSRDNDFQRRLEEDAQREAKRHDFQLFVESAQFDASRQVAQIREAIKNASATQLVAMLVSGVQDEELRPVAQEAARLVWIGPCSMRQRSSTTFAASTPSVPSRGHLRSA